MKELLTIPFLRILIPFVPAVLIGIGYQPIHIDWAYLASLFLIITALNFYIGPKQKTKLFLHGFMDLFLFLYGLFLVDISDLRHQDQFYGNNKLSHGSVNFIALIDDLPVSQEKYVKCKLRILEIRSDSGYKKSNGQLIGYFRKSTGDSILKTGAVLLIRSRLRDIGKPKNPQEFDYKGYLENRQVYNTVFVSQGCYSALVDNNQLNPIWKLGLFCKGALLHRLKNSLLSRDGYALCSALLTGYDDEVSQKVLDSFAHTGTLHVLSVSGLHTGLIYLGLGFLINLADRRGKYKLAKFLIISCFLWLFALMTGFSPPVLRAVIMFNLLGIGKIYFRNDSRNQINILCASAFLLLSYNPFFIVDLGFQLSYLAMVGLIYFQPKFSSLWKPQGLIPNSLWQSITASFAAMLNTLPLTLFYFKQFPIWFFLCNVAVIPATFILLVLSLLVVLKLYLAAILINYLVIGLLSFVNLFSAGKYGFIDQIDFSGIDAFCLFGMIILFSAAIQFRSRQQLVLSLLLLIGWQSYVLFNSYFSKRQTLLSVYQIKNKSVCSLKNRTFLFLNEVDLENYNYHIKPQVTSFNNVDLVVRPFNHIRYGPHSVLILYHPFAFPEMALEEVTLLVLCNNFKLADTELTKFKKLQTIVMDGSNNNFTIKKSLELSRKFGVNFYNTASRGAYLLNLE